MAGGHGGMDHSPFKGWVQWHPQHGADVFSNAGTQHYPFKPAVRKPVCAHGMDKMGKCLKPMPGDADGDGVLDPKDQCPKTPFGLMVDMKGCSMDADGDGVRDSMDRCPDTPAGYPVDERGCTLDSDRDGVIDPHDKCPGTEMGVSVDAVGCDGAPDVDGDGVLNAVDACPDTPEGLMVSANGCWKVDGIYFNTNSHSIKTKGIMLLKEAAAVLKKYSHFRVGLHGHTDARASDAYNMSLSKRRAEAATWYLNEKQGISRERLEPMPFGESKPAVENAQSATEMQLNRRIELHRIP
uniref:Putative Outer membrane protein with four thrombospondin type 3 repeat domains and one peptide glycan binding domain. Thrombospondin type 3 repeat probably binds to calcium n=1 Tax=Magnetococcus massalia (strain MO-1) TaxID=451514 RepID=A0A1S7LH41_MAGMO|nr:Putative Outer membrane protein with four thrombospondin type 3 repeat domains and one peptide glycan binding domain. Thrombospondin type 3 repeat probably binds to calcium [Candidatus Magnetococcus massalia]